MGELGYDRKIEAVARTASNSMPCKGLDRMSWHTPGKTDADRSIRYPYDDDRSPISPRTWLCELMLGPGSTTPAHSTTNLCE